MSDALGTDEKLKDGELFSFFPLSYLPLLISDRQNSRERKCNKTERHQKEGNDDEEGNLCPRSEKGEE